MIHIFFNPLSGKMSGKDNAENISALYPGEEVKLYSVTDKINIRDFFEQLPSDDTVILCGGDGTLNRFINELNGYQIKNKLMFSSCGTGNDFIRDIAPGNHGEPVQINEYIENLPTVTVNGKEYRFINGVGYGIDGYCCEVGDELRKIPGKKVDYTKIAIKGLLGGFKPVNATVTVDGKEHIYKKTWLAPTMYGRYYGGGMLPAPAQDRLSEEKLISVMIMHGSDKLKTLMVFPSIFKGEHIKHKEMCEVLSGRKISVRFDRPCALQIDGETILNVTEYHAQVSMQQNYGLKENAAEYAFSASSAMQP